ncbi:hypothetical protein VQZ12_004903 [Salmonella enterica]|nr:hypothetical protein [Salmonella enterica]ECI0980424.1 hypothetical protein [Salmonella enterica subsp. enterica serovar Newport]ECQ8982916.1 hypothetical protein [Salmonella enterica subsp. enterica]EDW4550595.1 hypothetical protein [Salmonella enterica subsp. salamae]EBH1935599.1 hypothetical protein [Salmonella enterica]
MQEEDPPGWRHQYEISFLSEEIRVLPGTGMPVHFMWRMVVMGSSDIWAEGGSVVRGGKEPV